MSFRCFQALVCSVLSVLCFLCSFLIHFPFSIFSSGNTMPCGIRCFHGFSPFLAFSTVWVLPQSLLVGRGSHPAVARPYYRMRTSVRIPPPHLSVSGGGRKSTSCLVIRTFHPSPLTIKFYIKKTINKKIK